MASWMLGIDTGGRFTDPIAVDAESGARRLAKLSSDPSDIGFLVHGTTVATNAPVGGKGVVDKTGRIVVSYARPIFWAPPSRVGDSGGARPAT